MSLYICLFFVTSRSLCNYHNAALTPALFGSLSYQVQHFGDKQNPLPSLGQLYCCGKAGVGAQGRSNIITFHGRQQGFLSLVQDHVSFNILFLFTLKLHYLAGVIHTNKEKHDSAIIINRQYVHPLFVWGYLLWLFSLMIRWVL